MSKWCEGHYEIDVFGGRERVAGFKSGPFGMTQHDGTQHDGVWRLTHLLTGWKVCDFIVGFKKSQALAEQLMRVFDWAFTNSCDLRDEDRVKTSRAVALCRKLGGVV